MIRLFRFLPIMTAFIFFGCQDRNAGSRPYNVRDIDPLSIFPKPEALKGEVVKLDKEFHGYIGWSTIHKGRFMVTHEGKVVNGLQFFLIDLETKKLYKFLNHGRGPCEFGAATFAFDIDLESRIISLYDNIRLKLIQVNIDSVIAEKSSYEYCPEERNIINTGSKPRMYYDLKKFNENQLLTFQDELSDSMYNVIDLNKGVSIPFLPYPDFPKYEEKYQNQCNMLFSGRTHISKSGKIALIAQPALIDILNYDGNTLSRIHQIEYFRYNFGLRPSGGISRGYVDKNGFTCGDVTDSYIYAGYDGLSDKEWAKLSKVDGSYRILIHDWEGNPVKALLLDRHLIGFIVTDDDKTIYGFADDNKGLDLVRYTIN